MRTYHERAAEQIWDLLREGRQALISDVSLGPVGAAKIADTIQCFCAYRYESCAYEFSIDELAPLHRLDLILRDGIWREVE